MKDDTTPAAPEVSAKPTVFGASSPFMAFQDEVDRLFQAFAVLPGIDRI